MFQDPEKLHSLGVTPHTCRVQKRRDVPGSPLPYFHIEQLQPVLERLQGEAAEDQAYAEGAQAALGEAVGVVLDHGDDRDDDSGQDAGQP